MKFLKLIRKYKEISRVEEVSRRYFVMNGFDGILTFLGLLLGIYISGNRNASLVLIASFSTGFAVALSGFFGTYMSERAERAKRIKRLERIMLTKLKRTIVERAASFACLYSGLINAISPLIFLAISSLPFFLSVLNLISFELAFLISLLLVFSLLFGLGIYLGKISEENPALWGMKMVLIGTLITLILLSLSLV